MKSKPSLSLLSSSLQIQDMTKFYGTGTRDKQGKSLSSNHSTKMRLNQQVIISRLVVYHLRARFYLV